MFLTTAPGGTGSYSPFQSYGPPSPNEVCCASAAPGPDVLCVTVNAAFEVLTGTKILVVREAS